MAGIFWFAIAAYVCIGGYKFGFGSFREPGPGFIFIISGSFLAILSLIDFCQTLKKNASSNLVLGLHWRKATLVFICVFAYSYIFNFLGFVLSTFLLLMFLFKTTGATKWWHAILASFITTMVAYIVFSVWLQIQFPKGILGA